MAFTVTLGTVVSVFVSAVVVAIGFVAQHYSVLALVYVITNADRSCLLLYAMASAERNADIALLLDTRSRERHLNDSRNRIQYDPMTYLVLSNLIASALIDTCDRIDIINGLDNVQCLDSHPSLTVQFFRLFEPNQPINNLIKRVISTASAKSPT